MLVLGLELGGVALEVDPLLIDDAADTEADPVGVAVEMAEDTIFVEELELDVLVLEEEAGDAVRLDGITAESLTSTK